MTNHQWPVRGKRPVPSKPGHQSDNRLLATKDILLSLTLLTCLAGVAGAAGGAVHSFSGCGFPDTGQTLCYDNQATPAPGACPHGNPGQDGDRSVSADQPSYTIYNPVAGSSVTVDNRTGLMWASTGSNNGNTAVWTDALLSCENSTFAGYSDWRLPNVRELASIVDYGAANAPFINTTAFPGTQSNGYWTSTTYMPTTTKAWDVFFDFGNVSIGNKTTNNYVRCVRGGP